MTTLKKVNRRDFLRTSAAGASGLLLSFTLPESVIAQFAGGAGGGGQLPNKPHAYVHVATDNSVTFIIPKAEMGQGSMTSLSQLLADELDADWSKVRTEFAPVDPDLYGPLQGVVGSQSIRTLWIPMRRAGATARDMLIQAAAQRWSANKSQIRTENGFAINTASNARLSYGSLTEDAAKLPVPTNVPLKDPKDFKIIAKPVKRLDTRDKVTGRAQFGIDSRLPGMVYAVLERSPVFGGKVVSFDATKAKAVPGVKDVIQISAGVAVLADNTWSANQGRKALTIQWDEAGNGNVSSASISKMFMERAAQPGVSATKEGDAEAALAAGKKIEAVYEAPFLSHAPMEPMNCTATVTADSCEVWVSTQMQTPSRDTAAMITGLPPEKCKIHTTFLGGGFGRRGRVDYVSEAVEIAKAAKVPVKLTWTREDDMQHDYYRPASYVKFAGAVDSNGWLNALSADVACPAFPAVDRNGLARTAVDGIFEPRYEIPNIRVDYHRADTHVPVSFWRSVGWSQNGFFMESFIDELAHTGGKDPVEFRRRMLAKTPRMLGVLNLAAEKAGWGKAPSGHFQGVSAVNNIGSFTAQVAEISVTNGNLKIHRIVCAVDCGHIVNPAIIRQQIEGGIVYGLSAVLKGAITLDRGRVQQGNFNTYDVLRINEMPQIEVHIVPSTEAPGGIGEASTPGIAPAIANAIFAATNKRLRKLPIRNTDLA